MRTHLHLMLVHSMLVYSMLVYSMLWLTLRRPAAIFHRRLGTLFSLLGVGLVLVSARPILAADGCACSKSTCAEVSVDADNAVDFNCASSLVGQTLPDSDADGIPDACDACPCLANPLDEDTGRARECPEPPLPEPEPEPEPRVLSPISCVDGEVTGIPATATVWLLRPRTLAFTRFEAGTHELAAGAHVLVLRNLNVDQCELTMVGGKPTVKRLPPKWHLRAGVFASAAVNVGELNFDAVLGLDGGIDYRWPASAWALGPSVHVLTMLGSADPVPVFLGLGPRLGIFDVVAVTPFVQVDVLNDGQLSYGVWVTFDVGALEDLGIEVEKLAP